MPLKPRYESIQPPAQTSTDSLCFPQLTSMKSLKGFLPSLYSEYLITAPASGQPAQPPDNLLLGTELGEKSTQDGEGDLRGPGGVGKGVYARGLGDTFGFPGDARKMRERSKMKLWREYFLSRCRSS